MRIEVDTVRCCAAGQCVLAAPGVFDQDEETGTVVVLDPSPPPEQHEAVRAAARVCPARVIVVSET